MADIFLYAPQDFHNLCLLVRTLEAFGHRRCFVFDPHRLIRERYGKVRTRESRRVSAGAFEKMSWERVERPGELLSEPERRVVVTVAEAGAEPLSGHVFEPADLVVFGSESRGLPREVLERADVALTIPLLGETRSLNLAVSVGIVLFELQRQRASVQSR
jgi:tRNA G18 (ribose-2'-O)-methylase SpoU